MFVFLKIFYNKTATFLPLWPIVLVARQATREASLTYVHTYLLFEYYYHSKTWHAKIQFVIHFAFLFIQWFKPRHQYGVSTIYVRTLRFSAFTKRVRLP